MSKLFKLKQWLSVGEAADHLEAVLNEPVSEADIYRLALDGHLRLSALFVNSAQVNLGRRIRIEEAEWTVVPGLRSKSHNWNPIEIPDTDQQSLRLWAAQNQDKFRTGELILMFGGDLINHEELLVFDEELTKIRDIWDLSMLASERLDVKHALMQEVGGPEITGCILAGTILVSPDGVTYARLLEHMSDNEYHDPEKKYPYDDPKSYYPAGALPSDAAIVVRTAAITSLIASLTSDSDQENNRDLRSDARQTYARVIGALWIKAHGDGGHGRLSCDPYSAAESLAATLSDLGIDKPSPDKIGRILAKEVPETGIKIGTSEKNR